MKKFRLFPFFYDSLLAICFIACSASFAFSSEEKLEDSKKQQIIKTEKGNLIIYPIRHATFVMKWDGKTIYVDPVGGGKAFREFERPDLIILTDIHGDHLNEDTINAVKTEKTKLLVPKAAQQKLNEANQTITTVMANGDEKEILGIKFEAIPMYNLTKERMRFHPKGRGNGYVLTMADKRIYIAGDTEDIPEMRQLKAIDIAFLCMNLPYTMDIEQAADAVQAFKPKRVYPYHHRGSDVDQFKKIVEEKTDTEVRLLEWYP